MVGYPPVNLATCGLLIMLCHGGFLSIRHDEARDLTADLTEVCHDMDLQVFRLHYET